MLINGQKAQALWRYDGKIEALPGGRIDVACCELVMLAKERGEPITITFNGTEITAIGEEDPAALLAAWSAEMDRKADAYRNSNTRKAHEAAALAEEIERKTSLDALLAAAPAKMTLVDAGAWSTLLESNTDSMGMAILTYAERWARCMEARMSAGVNLANCAKETSNLADVEGISGAMYGMAVRVLFQHWIHGDDLRRWHNLSIQIGKEGEQANATGATLNPAVVCIGTT